METFKQMTKETEKAIAKAYSDIGVDPHEHAILNIVVSYDGVWQKGGLRSHNGVASVTDMLTGLAIGFQVLLIFS